MPETIVDLIRHGEPEGGRMIRGSGIDHPLSALGWQQMRAAIGDQAPWDQIVSSPMFRCRPFASELAGRHGLPLAVEPALREIGMGAWEGRRAVEIAAAEPVAYGAFREDPVRHRPPGGETLEALAERVGEVFDRLVALHPGRHLLLVCHAGVTRGILGHALGAAPSAWHRLRIDYAGLSRIRHGRFGAVVEHVNARRIR
ncbi:histidine phosphatase family protein [Thiococcus pfennigii]|uniref:histidine phosphatase family protein n=1 Tax=Thiococcus pfennigii TaxID=1057 RepID=UPI001907F423|nr:histidine phosphatase family protein [Thiococcus pfennigii]MBK1733083.1 histidine phosphatase family protein [Thiococcus pfennigii]